MSVKPIYLALAGALMLTACGEKAPETMQGPVAVAAAEPESLPDPAEDLNQELYGQGETIAETVCSQCHSIRAEGDSPHPDAPPFRTLHERFDIEVLAEPLVEGIMVGHPDMPEFQFDPQSADSLIVFIKSLQPDE